MSLCDCGELSKPLKSTREGEVPRCGRCYAPLVDPKEFELQFQQEKAELDGAEEQLRARLESFLVVTTDHVPGHTIEEVMGVVQDTASTTIQSSDEKKGIWNTQEKRMAWAVENAMARMIDKAIARGANAVIGTTVAVNESEGGVSRWRSTGAVVMGTAVVVSKGE